MRRVILSFISAAALGFMCAGQDGRHELELVMRLKGCVSPEEMDSDEVERLSAMLARPLCINSANERALVASGLMSRYQIASLADYRSRHGDVMSYSELASIDGFGESFTAAIAPFISLGGISASGGGIRHGNRSHYDVAAKTAVRDDIAPSVSSGMHPDWNYGLKIKASSGGILDFSAGLSNDYSSPDALPSAFTGSIGLNFRKMRTRVTIGDFNARFGQGLALWNGMTMGALDSPSSFMRKPTGISSSWSYTGSAAHTGAAAEFSAGDFSVSAFASVPGLKKLAWGPSDIYFLPAMNVTWLLRSGQVSATHYAELRNVFSGEKTASNDMKTSVDAAFCLKGTDLFSEVTLDWLLKRPAALAGTSFRVCQDFRMAAMGRYYPTGYNGSRSGSARSSSKCSDECAATLSGEFYAGDRVLPRGRHGFAANVRRHGGTFSADAAFFPAGKQKGSEKDFQFQLKARTEHLLSDCIKISVRLTFRYRTWGEPFRTDCRADFSFLSGRFSSTVRLNALSCTGTGLLGYMEGGYSGSSVSLYLRQGFFLIDNWNDRIYVYERDAPGAFVVPALYGRGLWTSAYASWRFSGWGRIYLRAAFTAFPFMSEEKKKPGRAELKIQFVFRL